jgi:hypothetical protein
MAPGGMASPCPPGSATGMFPCYLWLSSVKQCLKHIFGRMHDKSDVTNRFGDGDFVLAVCTCFLCNSDRFEVVRDFRSLKNGRIPFPVNGSIAQQKLRHHSLSGWRFRYSRCRNSPCILLRSKVLQEFHALAAVKKLFQLLGQINNP